MSDTAGAVICLKEKVRRLAEAETLAEKALPLREIRKAFKWLERDLAELRIGADVKRAALLRKRYEEDDGTEDLKEELLDYIFNQPETDWTNYSRDALLSSEDLFSIARHLLFDVGSPLEICEVVGQGLEGTGYVYDLLREANENLDKALECLLLAAHQVEIEETPCKCGRFHDYPPEECEGRKTDVP